MNGPVVAESSAPGEVIERIRKLFALAGSPNEHEAALALEKAHALLLRYNLRAEAVNSGANAGANEVTEVWLPGFGGYRWRSRLLGMLAGHCFCQPLRTRDQVVLVGRPTNIAAARALYMWLVPQLERLCLEEFEPMRGQSRPPLCPRRKLCKGVGLEWSWVSWWCPDCGRRWAEWDRRLRRRPAITLRTFKVAFMAGAVERIEHRLRMQRYAEMTQIVGGRSLMLATEVENDNYIARRFAFIRYGPEREQSVDRAAFESGWRRAEEVSLSNRLALPSARRQRSGRR